MVFEHAGRPFLLFCVMNEYGGMRMDGRSVRTSPILFRDNYALQRVKNPERAHLRTRPERQDAAAFSAELPDSCLVTGMALSPG